LNTIARGPLADEELAVAWMRMMGAESVDYHRETIIERGDDHPGTALDYYASRGETPLAWGGSGAASLGLFGAVDNSSYDALYGPGGATDPTSGERLVSAKRPGMELVIAAHKSVAELGVLGRAEDMHAIMDAERDATLAYLDEMTKERGGRRGVAAIPTETTGLVYSHARHATTRAGDPGPHDHVLIANVIEMRDERGGTKAPDTTLWREHLHAATMVGRLASAKVAVDLGYGIEADGGPTGKLGHWKIAGIPDAALAVHSKRAAEINQAVSARGFSTYQARAVAARETRKQKRHSAVDDLVPMWRGELDAAGFAPRQLEADIARAGIEYQRSRPTRRMAPRELSALAADVLGPEGTLSERKVFSRRDVIVAIAPHLYGRSPAELDRVVSRVLRDPEAIALLGVPRATERAYSTATVLAAERSVEHAVARGIRATNAASVTNEVADGALARQGRALGGPLRGAHLRGVHLTDGQMNAVKGITTSGRGVELVVGVAGSGKTTVMAAVRDAFEAGGYVVVGTSTSGQAARTLGREAGIAESRTLASLRWRIEHERVALSPRHVVVLDEAGMAADRDIAFLLDEARLAGSKVVLVGDDRQLGAVGVGGALGALIERHGGAVHALEQNVRQQNHAEREALAHLRAGDVSRAVEFYATSGRVVVAPGREGALKEMVEAWSVDVAAGKDTAMFAWRRANVAELNRLAREKMAAEGRLGGPEIEVRGGARYAAGDRIVTLAPGRDGTVVTSERGLVFLVDQEAERLVAKMDDGREQVFERDEIGATQLAYGYATTVHRSQGATTGRAHVYEDGGGRELAYVAMSRAKEHTHVYVAADDLDVAREDLLRAWQRERRWRWAIDTGTPEINGPEINGPEINGPEINGQEVEAREPASLRRQALVAERATYKAAFPMDRTEERRQATSERAAAVRQLDRLHLDQGRTSGGELGQVAGELSAARLHRLANERAAHDKDLSRKFRRGARHLAEAAARRERVAEEKVVGLFASEERRLTDALDVAERNLAALVEKDAERGRWLEKHPEVPGRLREIGAEISGIDKEMEHERRAVVKELYPAPERARTQGRSPSHDYSHDIEPPDLDFGLGL
jgi:conjugative relaxase-like TrwC/TraI family protein